MAVPSVSARHPCVIHTFQLRAVGDNSVRKYMIKVSVLYPYKPESRFDHDYYRKSHVPLIAERLGAGLLFYTIDRGIAGGKPNEPPPFVAMVNLFSESVGVFQTAFAPHADEIMRDIATYTDIAPITLVSEVVVASACERTAV